MVILDKNGKIWVKSGKLLEEKKEKNMGHYYPSTIVPSRYLNVL